MLRACDPSIEPMTIKQSHKVNYILIYSNLSKITDVYIYKYNSEFKAESKEAFLEAQIMK